MIYRFFQSLLLISFLNVFSGTVPSAALWVGNSYNGKSAGQFSLKYLDGTSTLVGGITNGNSFIYTCGMGNFGTKIYYAALWKSNVDGTVTAKLQLAISSLSSQQQLGSRASNVAVGVNGIYVVGPPDTVTFGNYTAQATIWYIDSSGKVVNTTFGQPGSSYAYGLTYGANGDVYIAGYDSHPYLWVTDSMLQTKYACQLSTSGTGASVCVTKENNCYVLGQDIFNNMGSEYNLAALWITSLTPSSVTKIQLDSFPPNVDITSYIDCCFLSQNCIYGGGAISNYNTIYGGLWIYDISTQKVKTFSFPTMPPISGIYVDAEYCYMVGGALL